MHQLGNMQPRSSPSHPYILSSDQNDDDGHPLTHSLVHDNKSSPPIRPPQPKENARTYAAGFPSDATANIKYLK